MDTTRSMNEQGVQNPAAATVAPRKSAAPAPAQNGLTDHVFSTKKASTRQRPQLHHGLTERHPPVVRQQLQRLSNPLPTRMITPGYHTRCRRCSSSLRVNKVLSHPAVMIHHIPWLSHPFHGCSSLSMAAVVFAVSEIVPCTYHTPSLSHPLGITPLVDAPAAVRAGSDITRPWLSHPLVITHPGWLSRPRGYHPCHRRYHPPPKHYHRG